MCINCMDTCTASYSLYDVQVARAVHSSFDQYFSLPQTMLHQWIVGSLHLWLHNLFGSSTKGPYRHTVLDHQYKQIQCVCTHCYYCASNIPTQPLGSLVALAKHWHTFLLLDELWCTEDKMCIRNHCVQNESQHIQKYLCTTSMSDWNVWFPIWC